MLNLSVQISDYYNKQNNDKVFAMGDMAGKVSFLLKKPVVQLEGLVSGRSMIEMIRMEKSLCDVFKKFQIDVYLTNSVFKKIYIMKLMSRLRQEIMEKKFQHLLQENQRKFLVQAL